MMEKIKIAHICTVDSTLRYVLMNQLLALRTAGFEVVGISATSEDRDYFQQAGFRHISVPFTRNFTPLQDLKSFWILYKILCKEKFTIVHTHNPKPGLIGQLAARLAKVPIVVNTIHGFYFHEHMPNIWRRFYITMEKIAAANSDIILSQNSEDVLIAVKEGISKPEKIEFLGNGIDINRFSPSSVMKNIVKQKREELRIPENAPVVGFVGRLVVEKGILELLQAAKIISKKIPSVKILIVGKTDSEKKDSLDYSIAAKYGVDDICIFAGQRHDLPDLYAMMDVFVLPSYREGFPRAAMEAAAMGIPVITTNIRGCRETVIDGYNGILVPVRNIEILADAITSLLLDKPKAIQMGLSGRCLAIERFDEVRVFEKVKATYHQLLQRNPYLTRLR